MSEALPTEKLLPVESMALTVGLAQVLRGDAPTPGVASTCILALARLAGLHDHTTDETDYRRDPCNQPENIR